MMKTFGSTSRADEKLRQLAVIMAVLVFIYIETRSEVLLKLPAHWMFFDSKNLNLLVPTAASNVPDSYSAERFYLTGKHVNST